MRLNADLLMPSFLLLGDLTGKTMGAETIEYYVRELSRENVTANAINGAIADIARGWTHHYWPSVEQIALRANQRMRDERNGAASGLQVMFDGVDLEAQRRWDERRRAALAWADSHRSLMPKIAADVDADIERMVRANPNAMIARNADYRAAYRQGALMGACLCGPDARGVTRATRIGSAIAEAA